MLLTSLGRFRKVIPTKEKTLKDPRELEGDPPEQTSLGTFNRSMILRDLSYQALDDAVKRMSKCFRLPEVLLQRDTDYRKNKKEKNPYLSTTAVSRHLLSTDV